MRQFFDRLWHGTFKRPYKLTRVIDRGQGTPVVLLHGLGSSSAVWQNLVDKMDVTSFRLIAFDLLGFGKSPKPNWLQYSVDDHANTVITNLVRLELQEPVIVVGHSMGCLIALRVARLRPDLVKHLILYEMPLYEGLPEKRRYQLRLQVYQILYKRIIAFEPEFNPDDAHVIQRVASKVTGFEITEQTWLPFKRSLENTIVHQTAAEDLKRVAAPMDVIYGRRDMLVIRGKPVKIFGEDIGSRIFTHTINTSHGIPKAACKFLAGRILEANEKNS